MVTIDLFRPGAFSNLFWYSLCVLLLLRSLWAWFQPRALQNSAHRDYFVPGFEDSPDRFFALVYECLKEDLTQSQLPFRSLGFGPRPLFARRNVFSARCLYLQVRYEHFSYYIYAVPAPGGLYVSSWLFSRYESWAERPILKWLVLWRLSQMTLFQYDIMRLFHSVVDKALVGVIDELRIAAGFLPLEFYERRPVLRGFYAAMEYGTPYGSSPPSNPPAYGATAYSAAGNGAANGAPAPDTPVTSGQGSPSGGGAGVIPATRPPVPQNAKAAPQPASEVRPRSEPGKTPSAPRSATPRNSPRSASPDPPDLSSWKRRGQGGD